MEFLKASYARRNIGRRLTGIARASITARYHTREAAPRVHEERVPLTTGTGPDLSQREIDCMAAPQPSIGDWYRQKEGGALFEVVAYDDDDGTIEIQYFDGTVEEMDIEDWDGQWE